MLAFSWGLSSSSDRLNHVICEITIKLSVNQDEIKLENYLKLIPEKWVIHQIMRTLTELPVRP